MNEQEYFLARLNNFSLCLENSVIDGIKFELDENPDFDKSKIPFKFEYCHSILLKVDDSFFKVSTAMTSLGVETLQIDRKNYYDTFEPDLLIKSKIVSTDRKFDSSKFAYRIDIKCESCELAIIAGEIYSTTDGV